MQGNEIVYRTGGAVASNTETRLTELHVNKAKATTKTNATPSPPPAHIITSFGGTPCSSLLSLARCSASNTACRLACPSLISSRS